MKVVLAGGIFRESLESRGARQPAPEVILSAGLRSLGADVVELPLERVQDVGWRQSGDIVHVHHLSKAAVAASVGRWSTPFVFTEHATGLAPNGRERWGQRLVLARADRIVCLSQAEFEQKLELHHLSPGRMIVIPNGFNLMAGIKPGEPRQRPHAPVRLLFVGQLKQIKQVDRILDALVTLEDCVLRLVYHNPEQERELQACARALGVANRVTFVGRKWGEDLFEEYKDADLLVLPSLSESLPSVIVEALACGLPIVASGVGGIRGQIGDAGVLVSPHRDVPIVEAIREVVAEYETFGSRAFARSLEVTREFSSESMAREHLRLYESLLRSS